MNRFLVLLVALLWALPAMASDLESTNWSETAASNINAAPNGWPSNSPPTIVYQTDREMMGAIKRNWNRTGPTVTSGGSANAQTLTYTTAPAALVQGQTYTFIAGFTNTGATTLAVNGLTATAINQNGAALAGGEITSGNVVTVAYDGSVYQLLAGSTVFQGRLNLRSTLTKGGDTVITAANTALFDNLTTVSGSCSGADGTSCSFNYLGSAESGSNGINSTRSVDTLGIQQTFGGSGVQGPRNAIQAKMQLSATTSNVTSKNYSAAQFSAFASANDNGTSVSTPFASGNGAIFGLNPSAELLSGATDFNGVVGEEVDVGADSGSSTIDKIGIQSVLLSNDAVSASRYGLGVAVTSQSNGPSAGFDIAFAVGTGSGFDPLASTGSVLACAKHNKSSACGTHAYGINLLDFGNFTTAAFASNGFSVDGSGNVIANALTGGSGTLAIAAATTSVVTLGNATDGVGFRLLDSGGSTVNLAQITPGKTGQAVGYSCGGPSSDSNVTCTFSSKGTSGFQFSTGGGKEFQISDTASAVDFVQVAGGAAGSPGIVTISAQGSDTAVSINLVPKGSGTIQAAGTAGVSCAANSVNLTTEVVTDGIVTHC